MYSDNEFLHPEVYQPAIEAFQAYRMTHEFHHRVYNITHEFYQELRHREAYQWYHETAQAHQQELEKMRGDINILGWFLKWRNS